MKTYTYRVVTSNGAGVHGGNFKRCADAKERAAVIAELERDSQVKFGPYEIERVEHVPTGGGVRYWMRQGQRWVPWDPHRKANDRKPDWLYGVCSAASSEEP